MTFSLNRGKSLKALARYFLIPTIRELTPVNRSRVGPASLVTGPSARPTFQEDSALGSNRCRAEDNSQAGI